MSSILNQITKNKLDEVSLAKKNLSLSQIALKKKSAIRDFVAALQQKNPAIIAEIKKASPSKGIIRQDFKVKSIAKIYEKHGAACLSVLTDQHYFQGHPSFLQLAKDEVSLPVLRKDFIIDPYQIHESRYLGADCILLIVAILDDYQLLDFCEEAQALGMAVLVESHDALELERALRLPTPLMGINNRSLHDFHTDLKTTIELAKYLPKDKILITESGIHSRADILFMQEHGIHTFLIGESLMRSDNIGQKLEDLLNKS